MSTCCRTRRAPVIIALQPTHLPAGRCTPWRAPGLGPLKPPAARRQDFRLPACCSWSSSPLLSRPALRLCSPRLTSLARPALRGDGEYASACCGVRAEVAKAGGLWYSAAFSLHEFNAGICYATGCNNKTAGGFDIAGLLAGRAAPSPTVGGGRGLTGGAGMPAGLQCACASPPQIAGYTLLVQGPDLRAFTPASCSPPSAASRGDAARDGHHDWRRPRQLEHRACMDALPVHQRRRQGAVHEGGLRTAGPHQQGRARRVDAGLGRGQGGRGRGGGGGSRQRAGCRADKAGMRAPHTSLGGHCPPPTKHHTLRRAARLRDDTHA